MKKGFVFIETIIVLMMVTMSLTLLLSSYTLVKVKSREKEKYDRIPDKYLLYTISNLGTTATHNYSVIAETANMRITPETCHQYTNVYKLTQTTKTDVTCSQSNRNNECSFYTIFYPNTAKNVVVNTISFSDTDTTSVPCKKVLQELNVKYLYVVNNVDIALKNPKATSIYDNGTINYMKTLRKCRDEACSDPIKYLIAVFERYEEYYFASIEI